MKKYLIYLWIKRAVAALLAVGLFGIGVKVSEIGFNEILDFRLLERIPPTLISGSVEGEVQLNGRATVFERRLTSPRDKAKSFYYRYLVEREERDSDGDTRWVTVTDDSDAVPFILMDESSQALVMSSVSAVRWFAPQLYRQEVGDYRYTEWRIDENTMVTVFGWLRADDQFRVEFHPPGDYLPIVSGFSADEVRSEIGFAAILWLWGGVTAFLAMCLALFYALLRHRTLVFLLMVSISVTLLLAHYGIASLESDVSAGYERVLVQRTRADSEISKIFTSQGIRNGDSALAAAYNGLDNNFDLSQLRFAALTDAQRTRINRLRNTVYEVRARYLRQIAHFPESYFAAANQMDQPLPVALPPDQMALVESRLGEYQSTRTESYPWLSLLALLAILVIAWFAFRQIGVKRMIENLPTSSSTGVVYGMTELKGELVPEDPTNVLCGPLTKKNCCWYHYIVEERRGTGKNASWVTIEDRIEKQPFYCRDDDGQVRVFPVKADVMTHHKEVDRQGALRYTEYRLKPGDELYILGRAKPDRTKGDTLVLSHDKEFPYIIANYTEAEIMFFKATRAMVMLALGLSLLFLVCLGISGANGSFSSLDFVMLSGVGPLFLFFMMTMVMYNDLIFLRLRCERNWANIEVSLKKRSTLVPQLEGIVKRYMSHEADLQALLVAIRNQARAVTTPADLDDYMAIEHKGIDRLSLAIEDYPELKADKLAADLTRSLVRLENEVAMIRAGYNDAVMTYNTRVQSFPDNLLAKLFKFETRQSIAYDGDAHHIVPKASGVTV